MKKIDRLERKKRNASRKRGSNFSIGMDGKAELREIRKE